MRVRLVLFALFSVTLAGCGHSSNSSQTGQLRFVQASPDSPQVDLLVDGKKQASGLLYMNASAYLTLSAGSHQVKAVPVSGSSAVLSSSIAVSSNKNQTLLMTGFAAGIQSLLLSDGGTTTTTAGDGHLRVVHAAVTMGSADVYIVPAGSGLGQAVTTNLAFNSDTGYQEFAAGNYQVFLTAPGTTNALLAAGPISLAGSQNLTIVALDDPAGGFTFTVLTDQ